MSPKTHAVVVEKLLRASPKTPSRIAEKFNRALLKNSFARRRKTHSGGRPGIHPRHNPGRIGAGFSR